MNWQLNDRVRCGGNSTVARSLAAALVVLSLFTAVAVRAEDNSATSGTTTGNTANGDHGNAVQIDLKTTLEKGLRARRPQEFQYLARVAEMVADGDLPESLVRTTYGWARKKRPYPFQYFQRALQVRARKLGIDIPPVS